MKIIYYYHIPKCGGSTIQKSLRTIAESKGGTFHDFNHPMGKYGFLKKLKNNYKMKRFFKSLNDQTTSLKVVHHHHGYYGISEIEKILIREKAKARLLGNELYFFTCIREPISFQLSRVNYLRNSCGMPDFSFRDACQEPKNQNFMAKYFMRNHPKRWKDFALEKNRFEHLLGIMDKVILMEDLSSLYTWLSEILETSLYEPTKRENVGTHKLIPTDEQLKCLKQVNSFDQFFYDLVCSKETK